MARSHLTKYILGLGPRNVHYVSTNFKNILGNLQIWLCLLQKYWNSSVQKLMLCLRKSWQIPIYIKGEVH